MLLYLVIKHNIGLRNQSSVCTPPPAASSGGKYEKNLETSQLGYYLAGLIEGDGTIIVPTSIRSDKGYLNYPSIQISFNSKDYPLSCKISEALGTGSICKKRNSNAYVLTINSYIVDFLASFSIASYFLS